MRRCRCAPARRDATRVEGLQLLELPQADGADHAALVARRERMRRVFADHESVLLRKREQRIEIGRVPVQVHRHHGACAGRQRPGHRRRVHVQRVGFDVDDDRMRARVMHDVRGPLREPLEARMK